MSPNSRYHQLIDQARRQIREVTPLEAKQLQDAGAILIDVRETEEVAAGAAAGAVHLSRGILELAIEHAVPDVHTPLLLICGAGHRSALAAESLLRMGYTNVASVAGGMNLWYAQGLPTN